MYVDLIFFFFVFVNIHAYMLHLIDRYLFEKTNEKANCLFSWDPVKKQKKKKKSISIESNCLFEIYQNIEHLLFVVFHWSLLEVLVEIDLKLKLKIRFNLKDSYSFSIHF